MSMKKINAERLQKHLGGVSVLHIKYLKKKTQAFFIKSLIFKVSTCRAHLPSSSSSSLWFCLYMWFRASRSQLGSSVSLQTPHHHRGNGVPVNLTGEALKKSEMSLVILDVFPADGLICESDVTLDLQWTARSYWAITCSLPGSSWESRPAQEPDGKGIGPLGLHRLRCWQKRTRFLPQNEAFPAEVVWAPPRREMALWSLLQERNFVGSHWGVGRMAWRSSRSEGRAREGLMVSLTIGLTIKVVGKASWMKTIGATKLTKRLCWQIHGMCPMESSWS